jgi:hypothetical protein
MYMSTCHMFMCACAGVVCLYLSHRSIGTYQLRDGGRQFVDLDLHTLAIHVLSRRDARQVEGIHAQQEENAQQRRAQHHFSEDESFLFVGAGALSMSLAFPAALNAAEGGNAQKSRLNDAHENDNVEAPTRGTAKVRSSL